jgi:hypothetical protein
MKRSGWYRKAVRATIIVMNRNFQSYEDYCLLGYNTLESGRSLPTFWKNILPLEEASSSFL